MTYSSLNRQPTSSNKRRIVTTAPGRAGVIGNPSDMYGGSVISCSVDMRAKVELTISSVVTLVTLNEECKIHSDHDLRLRGDCFDIAKAVLQYSGLPKHPFRVEYSSTIPIHSGLAGSTALLMALLRANLAWQNESPDQYELAEMVCDVEYNHLKIVGGFQDAYMCAFGGLNYMDFRGKQFDQKRDSVYATVEPLHLLVGIELPFVLASTGVERVSGDVHKLIGERWLIGEPDVVAGYRRIAEIAKAGKKALINKDWQRLGELMNENHAIQRGFGGSGESNQTLIAAALEAGAPGAKLAGAGGGGTIIALWPYEDRVPLERALLDAGAAACYRPGIYPGETVKIC